MVFTGWLTTENGYYSKAKQILDNAIKYLTADVTLTFVWAEIIYLRRWYEEVRVVTQDKFKRYEYFYLFFVELQKCILAHCATKM